jgi:hypothetical protein
MPASKLLGAGLSDQAVFAIETFTADNAQHWRAEASVSPLPRVPPPATSSPAPLWLRLHATPCIALPRPKPTTYAVQMTR